MRHWITMLIMVITPLMGRTQVGKALKLLEEDIIEQKEGMGQYHEFDFDHLAVLRSIQTTLRSNEKASISIDIMDPSGKLITVDAIELPYSETLHYKKYPNIKTFKFVDEDMQGTIVLSEEGLTATVLAQEIDFYIEKRGDTHISYLIDQELSKKFDCSTFAGESINLPRKEIKTRNQSHGGETWNFRIAIAVTGEFFQARGGSLAAINADLAGKLMALNAFYNKELGINFQLIASNDDHIYSNPSTDPFQFSGPSDRGFANDAGNYFFNSGIDENSFDIGHALHHYVPNGGGIAAAGQAGLGVVCSSSVFNKGSGFTNGAGNYSISFFNGIFAHEIAHQLGASHTFYGTSNFCSGGNKSIGNGYEPGSGNSIMSYEGTCGAVGNCPSQNITPYSQTEYFHIHSINQILNILENSCYDPINDNNSVPVISQLSNYSIPIGTPFFLEGSASDANNGTLYYSWEEYDTDFLILSCPQGAPNDAAFSTTAPLFRSFDPSTTGNKRYFPQLSDVMNNTQTMGEILPQIARTSTFSFTVRDNIGGLASEDITVNFIDNGGAFEITNMEECNGFNANEQVSITWNVAGTNLSPISCSSVKISFSIDGGQSFPYVLASTTPNDGSHIITMPNVNTFNGKIKIEGLNNIFYNVNNSPIVVSSNCSVEGGVLFGENNIVADAGDPSLNLVVESGQAFNQVLAQINSSDKTYSLVTKLNNSCFNFTNSTNYELITIKALSSGTYTFSLSNISGGGASNVNLFDSPLNLGNPCSAFINGNSFVSGGFYNVQTSFSATLQAGENFDLYMGAAFGSSTYTINSSDNSNLAIVSDFPLAGNCYVYLIVDGNGLIKSIQDTPDLSDGQLFTGDQYSLYGLAKYGDLDLSTYVNGSISTFQSDIFNNTICADLSDNFISVTINGCTPGEKIVLNNSSNANTSASLPFFLANACEGDNIVFDNSLMGQTISFNNEISINANLSIDGLGMSNLYFSGGNSNRLFDIAPGVLVDINNVNLINSSAANDGGAFVNGGTVELNNVILTNNKEGSVDKAWTNKNGGTVIVKGNVTIN